MSDFPKVCPNCGRKYEWYEAECSVCHIALVMDDTASTEDGAENDERPNPDASLVVVFNATEPGLLALAKMALDDASIPYGVHTVGSPWIVGLPARAAWLPEQEVPAQIVVGSDEADKAREILAELEAPASPGAVRVDATPQTRSNTEPMATVQLHNADTNQSLGEITSDELQFLFDRLERESDTDDDFYIDAATIEMLEDEKAPQHLLDVLRQAVGSSEGVEVSWKEN